jgi:predicted ester cyclase
VPTIHSKFIIHRVLDEGFNQGNLAILDELVAPNGISHHSSWGTPANRMGLKQLIAMLRTAFPNLSCTVEDEITQDNKVAAHWKIRGTQTGIFLGNPPTSKPIVVEGLIYVCIENEQIIESWLMIDQMSVLQELGLVPPPLRRSSP